MHKAPLVTEKQVVFYPAYGYRQADTWHVPLRLWVNKPPDRLRRAVAKGARRIIRRMTGITRLTAAEKSLYAARAADFVADSESREEIFFRFDADPAGKLFSIQDHHGESKTDFNGLIEGTLVLDDDTAIRLLAAQQSTHGWLSFHAASKGHSGAGKVRLIPPRGLSVISDIDDTIKDTQIPKGNSAVLKKTFFQHFTATPGMTQMYSDFPLQTAFHYVSGGPWQMYRPLAEFLFAPAEAKANAMGEALFPAGSIHMKNVRTNPFESESYQDFWQLAAAEGSATVDQKIRQISRILQHFPERQFILIGDSGEHDPEIFDHIRDQYPESVIEIRIRDVVNACRNTPERLSAMTIIDAQTGQIISTQDSH